MLPLMRRLLAGFALFSLPLLACESAPAPAAGAAKEPSTAKPEQPEAKKRSFGEAITEQKTVPLPELLKEPSKFADQVVRTEGKVAAVCKKAGCWMDISDEAGTAHVKMHGHRFFIPKDASGHRAVVQAKVLKGDEGDVCGAKDDCGSGAAQAKLELEATGVELLD